MPPAGVWPRACRKVVQAARSDWLNSYGTFQPTGPNLRRSCTTLCRKHMIYSSWRQSARFTASSMSCTGPQVTFLSHCLAYSAPKPVALG